MKNIVFTLLTVSSFASFSQEDNKRLDQKIDEITYDWDLEADKLATYEGLQYICTNEAYRMSILNLLDDIHHYDSILYEVLLDLNRRSNDREIRKTLKEVAEFEEEYDTDSFISFMAGECKAMREIERNADKTVNDVGVNSYSGQVYLLETELYKYVKQVTNRVDKIRLHVHHLSEHY